MKHRWSKQLGSSHQFMFGKWRTWYFLTCLDCGKDSIWRAYWKIIRCFLKG